MRTAAIIWVKIAHPVVLFPRFERFLTGLVVPPAAIFRAEAAYHGAVHSAACMSASMKPPDWRRHNAA
jgi:hypothetical protein